MFRALTERLRQKHRTVSFPAIEPVMPDRFRGRPRLQPGLCHTACTASTKGPGASCLAACPTGALAADAQGLKLDMGRCLFCGRCEDACPAGGVRMGADYRLAASRREDLIVRDDTARLAQRLEKRMLSLFGRSLKLRQVSAGGCNGCEADMNVLSTIVFDLGRFGIEFVASPRHADGLLITGPVTRNMHEALIKCWEATPQPRLVIAVGACAISGGPYMGLQESLDGAAACLPVDLFIPGCPPHPYTSLDGMLRLLGRI